MQRCPRFFHVRPMSVSTGLFAPCNRHFCPPAGSFHPLLKSFGVTDMKPKTTSILIALLINLGLTLGSPPSPRGASAEPSSTNLFHCCKKTHEGRHYCCEPLLLLPV